MKKFVKIFLTVLISTLVTSGLVYAATTRNITSTLAGKSGDTFDLDGTLIVDSLKVGAQGTGGVTFFNGTIVNNTTTSGADNPVTFGDNVRIDGRIYRGATAGTSDSLPVLVNDNMEVAGSLTTGSFTTTGGLSSGSISTGSISATGLTIGGYTGVSKKIYEGTIDVEIPAVM
jgi:hypothetical protein